MASYQEIESKLALLSERVDFAMKFMRVPVSLSRLDPKPQLVSLWDLYLASKGAGLSPVTDIEAVAEKETV